VTLEFSLTSEQDEIRKLAHRFAEKEIRPVAAHFDETEEFPYDVVASAHRLGLSPAAFLPEQYGGQGLDFLTELILNEELSWGCAGIAVCIQSMALAIAGIRSSGTEEQKKRWLPEFTNPDKLVLGGLGLTEPDSGSDALAQIWEGTAEIQRLVISRAISGQRATIKLGA
jgi:alkylation response protein AidB-like acyl-CoA dehydrogenase